MKLRIKGNSLRLRLTKSEVRKLWIEKKIFETTSFGKNNFIYELQCDSNSGLSAELNENKITVFIPESFAKDWDENDIVGIEANIELKNNEVLNILVEKDFKCIERTSEDQSDNFENPNNSCASE